jgi:glycyl-tRNA synthetase
MSGKADRSEGVMEKVVSLCKRRGFIFAASEIYGGLSACYDYGPLGVELKRNVKDAWWREMVTARENVVGLDSAIIQHPRVWHASGHVEGFNDPLVDCLECRKRFREDFLEEDKCPECGGALSEPRQFNLMFKTTFGPVEDSGSQVFLRPETAQGIFINYLNVLNSSRQKLPFGIAQMGKAFRNEIVARNFVFRMREFEQMEMEFFCAPGDDVKWYEYWVKERLGWYEKYGIRAENLRLRAHEEDELAHYAEECTDVEYRFPFGWSELEGIARRTDYDLGKHTEYSEARLQYFDEETKEKFIPYVVEPSGGVDRTLITFMVDAFEEETLVNAKGKEEKRTVLHFHPLIAPTTVAVFPLVRRDGMPDRAREIAAALRDAGIRSFYDEKGAIGRRYRRQDEVGTPWCLTVDGQTAEDGTVTIRDRDTMAQERIPAGEAAPRIQERIAGWKRTGA